MNNTFIGITVGPIYSTFQHARKTREYWAASFTFSLLSKYLIDGIEKLCGNDTRFILPDVDALKQKPIENAGIYPDRIIFNCRPDDWKKINEVIDFALESLAKEIQIVTGKDNLLKAKLKKYFKIFAAQAVVEDGENTIEKISGILNIIEKQNTVYPDEGALPVLLQFFKEVNKKGHSFLARYYRIKDAQGDIRIPSIVEISAKELEFKDPQKFTELLRKEFAKPEEDDGSLFDTLKIWWAEKDRESKTKTIRSYHKYIAILSVDGDRIGTVIKHLEKSKEADFSKQLIDWGRMSLESIEKYSALPIYVGGDNIVCFAPVNNGSENIFDLIKKIRDNFVSQPLLAKNATLRFGLAIAYYKHPMAETFARSGQLLYTAKHAGGNPVAVDYLKHSGSRFELLIDFDSADGKSTGLFQHHVADLNKLMVEDESFLSSVIYKIRDNECIFILIQEDPARTWNWFQNNFDEAGPKV